MHPIDINGRRQQPRVKLIRELAIKLEGFQDEIPIHDFDISTGGMFVPTPEYYAEGSVLKLSFVLPRSNYNVRARAEVKYCLAGIGVGVQFVALSDEAQQAIQQEYGLGAPGASSGA